jgi:hypothetical protein
VQYRGLRKTVRPENDTGLNPCSKATLGKDLAGLEITIKIQVAFIETCQVLKPKMF